MDVSVKVNKRASGRQSDQVCIEESVESHAKLLTGLSANSNGFDCMKLFRADLKEKLDCIALPKFGESARHPRTVLADVDGAGFESSASGLQ